MFISLFLLFLLLLQCLSENSLFVFSLFFFFFTACPKTSYLFLLFSSSSLVLSENFLFVFALFFLCKCIVFAPLYLCVHITLSNYTFLFTSCKIVEHTFSTKQDLSFHKIKSKSSLLHGFTPMMHCVDIWSIYLTSYEIDLSICVVGSNQLLDEQLHSHCAKLTSIT